MIPIIVAFAVGVVVGVVGLATVYNLLEHQESQVRKGKTAVQIGRKA